MTTIRNGMNFPRTPADEYNVFEQIEGYAQPCIFCGNPVRAGAFWRGATPIWLCGGCAQRGRLGALLGDAAFDVPQLQRMLDETEKAAWRAFAIASEREVGKLHD